jgi:ATP-dependent RNA helicase RhlE
MTQETLSNFASLGLAPPIVQALHTLKFLQPTPIQSLAIPILMSGKDLVGIAQTGTGKTAAFGLPLLHKISMARKPLRPRTTHTLILVPTRELAVQIEQNLRAYARHMPLNIAVVLGGVSQHHQIKQMKKGVHVLVATPGRLLDLARQHAVDLRETSTLVIDEADRMFDMGFIDDVRHIIGQLPKDRQSMLFSATISNELDELVHEILSNPERIEVSPPNMTAELIEQRLYHVPTRNKRSLLTELLNNTSFKRVIVFTRTKHAANTVSEHLEHLGISSDAIHGNKSQNARQRALARFRSGNARVLVATDVAARGIDVSGITHVINFELPNEAANYVHRIGRTARAGTEGIAISFCDSSERSFLRDIERLVQNKITVLEHELAPTPSEEIHYPDSKRSAPKRGQRHHHKNNDAQKNTSNIRYPSTPSRTPKQNGTPSNATAKSPWDLASQKTKPEGSQRQKRTAPTKPTLDKTRKTHGTQGGKNTPRRRVNHSS